MSTPTLHRHGFITPEFMHPKAAEPFGKSIEGQVRNLTALVDRVQEQATTIRKDRGLRPEGIISRLQKVGERSLTELGQLDPGLGRRVRAAVDRARDNLPTDLPKLSEDPTRRQEQWLRHGDILRCLSTMDLQEAGAEIATAGERGDVELLQAVKNAPNLIRNRLIADAKLDSAIRKCVEVTRPGEFEQLEAAKDAVTTFEGNMKVAQKLISEATGTPLLSDIQILGGKAG